MWNFLRVRNLIFLEAPFIVLNMQENSYNLIVTHTELKGGINYNSQMLMLIGSPLWLSKHYCY